MKKNILKESVEDQKQKMHKDHRTWTNTLEFYDSEIRFFKMELEKVLRVNSSNLSVIEHVKEYQVILESKKLSLIELQEEIKYQKKIFDVDEIVPDNISYHLILKDKIEKFCDHFEQVKPNLKRFASHRD